MHSQPFPGVLGLTAIARAHWNEATANRYLYPGVIFLFLLGAELFREVRVSVRVLQALGVVTAIVVVSNIGPLRDGGRELRTLSEVAEAELGALELVRNRVDPGYPLPAVRGTESAAASAGF